MTGGRAPENSEGDRRKFGAKVVPQNGRIQFDQDDAEKGVQRAEGGHEHRREEKANGVRVQDESQRDARDSAENVTEN